MPVWGNRVVMTTDPIKLKENKKIAKNLSAEIEKTRERRQSMEIFQHQQVENLKQLKRQKTRRPEIDL